jgi:hypothetical protein
LDRSSLNFQAGAEISTVNPDQYLRRFQEFIAAIIVE